MRTLSKVGRPREKLIEAALHPNYAEVQAVVAQLGYCNVSYCDSSIKDKPISGAEQFGTSHIGLSGSTPTLFRTVVVNREWLVAVK